jgi:hypothetical protein
VTQVRTFVFDGLGQLRSEAHPELGAAGNGTKSYDFYDVLGNPGSGTIAATSGRLIEVFDGRDLDNPLRDPSPPRARLSGGGVVRIRELERAVVGEDDTVDEFDGGRIFDRGSGLNFSLPPSYTYRGPRTH